MAKTVLIVEDDADARGFLKYLIQIFGYQALEAVDGFEAIASAKQFRPSLILMDLSFPRMDGFEATALIRKVEGLERLPIVAVTALNRDEWDKAFAAGCVEVLQKPVDFQSLKDIVQRLIRNEGH